MEQPLKKQFWQAKIRLHELSFAFYAYGNLYEQIAYTNLLDIFSHILTIGPFSLTHKETEPMRPSTFLCELMLSTVLFK